MGCNHIQVVLILAVRQIAGCHGNVKFLSVLGSARKVLPANSEGISYVEVEEEELDHWWMERRYKRIYCA
jgi:hypothetical protein